MQSDPNVLAITHAHGHHGHDHYAAHGGVVPGGAASKPFGRPNGGAGVEYTCPMHPQVRQMGPGSCPICGMGLEPVLATDQVGDSPELRDMMRRLWVGFALRQR